MKMKDAHLTEADLDSLERTNDREAVINRIFLHHLAPVDAVPIRPRDSVSPPRLSVPPLSRPRHSKPPPGVPFRDQLPLVAAVDFGVDLGRRDGRMS